MTYVSESLEKEISSHLLWEVKRELPRSTSANVGFVFVYNNNDDGPVLQPGSGCSKLHTQQQ